MLFAGKYLIERDKPRCSNLTTTRVPGRKAIATYSAASPGWRIDHRLVDTPPVVHIP